MRFDILEKDMPEEKWSSQCKTIINLRLTFSVGPGSEVSRTLQGTCVGKFCMACRGLVYFESF